MRAFREEISAPVVWITTFRDEAQAVAIADDSMYGLCARVWTRDINRAYRVSRAIKAGPGPTFIISIRHMPPLVVIKSLALAVKPIK
ncbi:aldehyde dehydrogenase family protein [Erwinia psidii]|uniref:aldehyde dehydrogenase family protein n=1 Tax=Erwinia psidii TaxID=69224 RepID=UPI00226B956D